MFARVLDKWMAPAAVRMVMYVLTASIGGLMYLNEATLLNNVRARYEKDLIYVRLK